MNFFQALQIAVPKNETKNLLEKDAITKYCLTAGIAMDRSKTLKKEKEKRKMRKSQTIAFLL